MKYLIIFILLGLIIPGKYYGKDIGIRVNNVVAFQTKRITKIIEKEGACTSLQGHLVNTCKSAQHAWTLDVHTKVTNRRPITLEYIKHLRSYLISSNK